MDSMAALSKFMQLMISAQLEDRQRWMEMEKQRLLDIKEVAKCYEEEAKAANLWHDLDVQREKDRQRIRK